MHPSAFTALPQVDPDDVEFKRIGRARDPSGSEHESEDEKKAEVVNTAKKENLIVLNQLDPILDYMVMTFCLLNLGKQYFS